MRNNIIVRLVAFYVGVFVLIGGLFHVFPVLGDYVVAERERQGARASLELDLAREAPVAAGPTFQLLDLERSVPVLLSLLTATLVALPVVWVYQWTRPRRRYNQTFAHTLLVVPIAITLVVFLVKGSLALAFSLAGIVAAVRFRTTLDEPMDAVYLFIVIGTGLAAGVQLLFVGVIASIVFNAVALTVWRLNVGGQPAAINGWRLAEAGPPAGIEDAGGGTPPEAGRAAPPGAGGAAEEPGERFNSRLRLYVTSVEGAQTFAIPFVEERAKSWRLAEVGHEPDGTAVIEFDLRLKKSTDLAAFVREIEQGDPHVKRVALVKVKSKEGPS